MKILDKIRGTEQDDAGTYVVDAPKMVGVIPLGGGMTIGFEQAGFRHAGVNLEIPGWEANIALNRPEVRTYTALEEWERYAEETREDPPTLVYGSPPCQGVTGASRTSGADNPKNEWTLRFTDAALTMRPDFIVWENIPRMLSVGKSIVNRVDSMARDEGYSMSVHRHDVQGFGVSQRRKRVIFVLEKRGKERTWPSHTPLPAPTVWEAISDLDEIEPEDDYEEEFGVDNQEKTFKRRVWRAFPYQGEPHNEWQASLRSAEGFTTCHDLSTVDERFASVPPGRQWLAMPREDMTEKERSRMDDGRLFNAMELMRLHPDRVGPTLTGARNRIHPYRQRLLSVREASRLMGFPDDWRWAKPKEYQQFAAGVCPQVCKWYGDVIQSFVADRPLPAAEGRLF